MRMPSGVGNLGAAIEREPQFDSAAAAAREVPAADLWQELFSQAAPQRAPPPLLAAFLAEPSLDRALALWLRAARIDPATQSAEQLALLLQRAVSRLDVLLSAQVNAILHHPRFQKLEASWRGLNFLVDPIDQDEVQRVKVRVLNVTWKELARDAERAIEFDQSQLFRKIYNEEFGTPGGEPYGLLIGDYQIHPRVSGEHPVNDIEVLTAVSQVAAAAFAPFIASASPELFGVDRFGELARPFDLARTFDQADYIKWRSFRDSDDSRFVGLVLPRVLMRLPYRLHPERPDGFVFREDVEAADHERYLWGNACYALASIVVRAFRTTGWFADIRGVRRDREEGGLVTGLPIHSFDTDKHRVALKTSVDVMLADSQEKEMSDLGFVPLCHCKGTEYSAFYGAHSAQKPKKYDDPAATTNAHISAMLNYMLCVSRFAHYIKVIARDKLGSVMEAADVERLLHNWLHRYVTSDSSAGPETLAQLPLREASVQVRERPGKPGSFDCAIRLRPHYQLEELVAAVRLTTVLAR